MNEGALVLRLINLVLYTLFSGTRFTLGANGTGESDTIPCHSEAEESGAPIPERVLPDGR